MVKPLGIVAMLILLVSGPALARDTDEVFTKQIDLWGVTTTGSLYLKTHSGQEYSIPIKHCPVVNTRKQYQFTPIEIVSEFNQAGVWFRGRAVADQGRVTFYNRNSKRERVSCILGEPRVIS